MQNQNANYAPIISSSIIESMTGVAYWQDLNFVIQSCNLAAAKLFGMQNISEMVGHDPKDFNVGVSKNAPKYMELNRQAVRTKKTVTTIIVDRFVDDQPLAHLVRKSPVINGEGTVIGVLTQGFRLDSKETLADLGSHLAKIDVDRSSITHSPYKLGSTKDDFGLSSREAECLFYLIRGKSMRDVAEHVNRSPRTIEGHVESIKRKMNCESKAAVIEKAIGAGYLSNIPKRFLSNQLIIHI